MAQKKDSDIFKQTRSKRSKKDTKDTGSTSENKKENRKYINDKGVIIDLRPPNKPPEVKAASSKSKARSVSKISIEKLGSIELSREKTTIPAEKILNNKSVASPLRTPSKSKKRALAEEETSSSKLIQTDTKSPISHESNQQASPGISSPYKREALLDSVSDGQVYWATSLASKYFKMDRNLEKEDIAPDFGQQVDAFFGNPEKITPSKLRGSHSSAPRSPSCKIPRLPLPRIISIPKLPQSIEQDSRISAKQHFEEVLDSLRSKSIENLIFSTKFAEKDFDSCPEQGSDETNENISILDAVVENNSDNLSKNYSESFTTKSNCFSPQMAEKFKRLGISRFHSTPVQNFASESNYSQSFNSTSRDIFDLNSEELVSPRAPQNPLSLSFTSTDNSLALNLPSLDVLKNNDGPDNSEADFSNPLLSIPKLIKSQEIIEGTVHSSQSFLKDETPINEVHDNPFCSPSASNAIDESVNIASLPDSISRKTSGIDTFAAKEKNGYDAYYAKVNAIMSSEFGLPIQRNFDVISENARTHNNSVQIDSASYDTQKAMPINMDSADNNIIKNKSNTLVHESNKTESEAQTTGQKTNTFSNLSNMTQNKFIQTQVQLLDIDPTILDDFSDDFSDLENSSNEVTLKPKEANTFFDINSQLNTSIQIKEIIDKSLCQLKPSDYNDTNAPQAIHHSQSCLSDESFPDDELYDIVDQMNKEDIDKQNKEIATNASNDLDLNAASLNIKKPLLKQVNEQNSDLDSLQNGCMAQSSSFQVNTITLDTRPPQISNENLSISKKTENAINSEATSRLPERPNCENTGYVRCLVVEVQSQFRTIPSSVQFQQQEKVLRLYDEQALLERVAFLRDSWLGTKVQTGDYVNLIGIPDSNGVFVIDNTQGFLVLNPHCLISTTHLAASFSCLRRAILSDRVRPSSDSDTTPMILGNFFHEILQQGLLADRFDSEFLDTIAQKIVLKNTESLYTCEKDESSMLELLNNEIGHLQTWAEQYLGPTPRDTATFYVASKNLQIGSPIPPTISINRLLEIEESIWSPMFGLKGKIDASVQVVKGSDIHLSLLEFKTGKVNHPIAHRAQAILYTLMMSERYQTDVSHAWLFYLRGKSGGDMMTRVDGLRDELCSIIQARNNMTSYIVGASNVEDLPEMLKNSHVCQYCPVLSACVTFHKCVEGGTTQSSGIGELFESRTNHLSPTHLTFFRHWERLLTLEEGKMHQTRQQIWCLPSSERSKAGLCFNSMVVVKEMPGNTSNSISVPIASNVNKDIEDIVELPSKWFEYKFAKSCTTSNMVDSGFSAPPPSLAERIAMPKASKNGDSDNLTRTNMVVGDPIVISADVQPGTVQHIALAIGFVKEINENYVIVSLDRRLKGPPQRTHDFNAVNRQTYYGEIDLSRHPRNTLISSKTNSPISNTIYRIDKDELTSGMLLVRNNLVELMTASTGQIAHLRVLIVDLVAPSFRSIPRSLNSQRIDFSQNSQIPSLMGASSLSLSDLDAKLKGLNTDQKHAIKTVISSKDYTLILGMPGTGKTTTIARLIDILVQLGSSVLIAAHTHSAVDTILCKLHELGLNKVLRLGNKDKIHPDILRYTVDGRRTDDSGEVRPINATLLQQIYETTPIVATTCLGISHMLFQRRKFDYCIIDEASQVTLPICIGPLRFASRFVLVGDHYQLPPLVRNIKAKKAGLSTSLFKRLSESHLRAVVYLRHQYRMNQDIMDIANHLVYQHALRCGTHGIATSSLKLPTLSRLHEHLHASKLGCPGFHHLSNCWILHVIDPSRKVLFLDTDSVPGWDEKIGELTSNPVEIDIVVQLVNALRLAGVGHHQIGVISPYRTQLTLLASAVPGVEVLTVDRSQGRDKDCIIVSLVRSNPNNSVGDLLRDWRRINVALTRARHKLVIIGSASTFRLGGGAVLSELVNFVQKRNWLYTLPKDAPKLHLPHIVPEANIASNMMDPNDQNGSTGIHSLAPSISVTCPTLHNISQELFNV